MTNVAINITEAPVNVTVNVIEAAAPGGGEQNVYIQIAEPTLDKNLMWVELNPDNTIKTIWINTL